jgi:hypothetical protein
MKKDLMVIIPPVGKCPECKGKPEDCMCEDSDEIDMGDEGEEDDLGLDMGSDSEELDDVSEEDISLDDMMEGLNEEEDDADEDMVIMKALKEDDIVTFDSELRKRFDKWYKEMK